MDTLMFIHSNPLISQSLLFEYRNVGKQRPSVKVKLPFSSVEYSTFTMHTKYIHFRTNWCNALIQRLLLKVQFCSIS